MAAPTASNLPHRTSLRGATALCALLALAACTRAPSGHLEQMRVQPNATETIVLVRHGEKPLEQAHGQLDCEGLNRALALPAVLARYGHPAAIYAANPASQTAEGNISPWAARYSYVRPLATIEPYAIQLGMPVDAQIAATDIHGLERELLKPAFANALVVVAWEHLEARRFAESMLQTFNETKSDVPHWLNSDYDTVYVFRLTSDAQGLRHLAFSTESENLSHHLPTTCPTVSVTSAAPEQSNPAR